jgi:hypothetical protein
MVGWFGRRRQRLGSVRQGGGLFTVVDRQARAGEGLSRVERKRRLSRATLRWPLGWAATQLRQQRVYGPRRATVFGGDVRHPVTVNLDHPKNPWMVGLLDPRHVHLLL